MICANYYARISVKIFTTVGITRNKITEVCVSRLRMRNKWKDSETIATILNLNK